MMTAEQILLDLFEPRQGMDIGTALTNLELSGFKVVPLFGAGQFLMCLDRAIG